MKLGKTEKKPSTYHIALRNIDKCTVMLIDSGTPQRIGNGFISPEGVFILCACMFSRIRVQNNFVSMTRFNLYLYSCVPTHSKTSEHGHAGVPKADGRHVFLHDTASAHFGISELLSCYWTI